MSIPYRVVLPWDLVHRGAPAKPAGQRGGCLTNQCRLWGLGHILCRSLYQCQVGLVQMPSGSGSGDYRARKMVEMGSPHIPSGPQPGVHLPYCNYECPPTTHNRQQLDGSCFIKNCKDPSPCCPEPTGGLGRVGAREPEEALGSLSSDQGEKQAAATRPDSLGGTGSWPLGPIQLWLLVLQEAQLDWPSWMVWRWRPHNGQDCGVRWWAGPSPAV